MVLEEIDKDSNNYQTRSCMARSLDAIGKDAQNREKQEWARERLKLDSARKTRGIYFVDPDARKNWKDLWPQPCRAKDKRASRKWLQKSNSASAANSKTMFGRKVEYYESMNSNQLENCQKFAHTLP